MNDQFLWEFKQFCHQYDESDRSCTNIYSELIAGGPPRVSMCGFGDDEQLEIQLSFNIVDKEVNIGPKIVFEFFPIYEYSVLWLECQAGFVLGEPKLSLDYATRSPLKESFISRNHRNISLSPQRTSMDASKADLRHYRLLYSNYLCLHILCMDHCKECPAVTPT